MILTDEEILKATGWDYLSGDELILIRQANEAQLKKAVEWGNEKCPHIVDLGEVGTLELPKRACVKCWQSLLDEVKGA